MPRFLLPARRLLPVLVAASAGAAYAVPPLVLDGRFDDWDDREGIYLDAEDSGGAEIDLLQIVTSADADALFLKIGLTHTVNVQGLDGRLEIAIDADGDATTGGRHDRYEGLELVVVFSPPGDDGRPGRGAGVLLFDGSVFVPVAPAALGVALAPTIASSTIEVRIDRRAPGVNGRPIEITDRARLGIVATGRDTAPDRTDVLDITVDLVTPRPASTRDPLARRRADALRVVSWNGRYGALLKERERAQRVLAALAPDVVLLQELTDDITAAQVADLLRSAMPDGGTWEAIVGAGGDNLRCAVATRGGLRRHPAIEPIDYPNQAGRMVRSAGAAIEYEGRTIALLSAHLKCCGRIGDRSDQKREIEATALRTALAAGSTVDGIVVAGDMNLVGGRKPLELLGRGLDADAGDLDVVDIGQLDGRSNATWEDAAQPFVPGRLDYALVSGAAFEVAGGFVLDTRDLSQDWRAFYGLRADDTTVISDHFPVVVDLLWRPDVIDATP